MEIGKCSRSLYSTVSSVSIWSAKPPSPVPRTIAVSGLNSVILRRFSKHISSFSFAFILFFLFGHFKITFDFARCGFGKLFVADFKFSYIFVERISFVNRLNRILHKRADFFVRHIVAEIRVDFVKFRRCLEDTGMYE